MNQEQIEAAADFWLGTLDRARAGRDNGDADTNFVIAAFNANPSHLPLSNAQRAKYREAFAYRLSAYASLFSAQGRYDYSIFLNCDYGPCELLTQCATDAAISTDWYPWKTRMHLEPGYISVSEGYAAPDRTLWASPIGCFLRGLRDASYFLERYGTPQKYSALTKEQV